MTDTEPGRLGAAPVEVCQRPDCENPLPLDHHPTRKYCDEHQPKQSAKRRDTKPEGVAPKINIDLGLGSAKPSGKAARQADEIEAVKKRAASLAKMIATILMMAAGDNLVLQGDAMDLSTGADQWANAIGELAVHEAWLRKIATGGESGERAVAWMTAAIATAGLLLPILLRHDVLPKNLAAVLSGVTAPTNED